MSTETPTSTTGPKTHHTSHQVLVSADAATVYAIVADVARWPLYFPPTVRAQRLSGDERQEEIRIWALANEQLRTWVSRRVLDRERHRVEFFQTRSSAPVASMSGRWIITDRPEGGSLVVLEHTFQAIGDDPAAVEQIERAVETNSRSELEHLGRAAERFIEEPDLYLDFHDDVEVTGSLAEAYDFIYAVSQWPQRLPHVARLDLTENTPGLQYMLMDTRSPDGSLHRTVSGRVCEHQERIVYKQTVLPPVLAAHNGEWTFRELEEGRVSVRSRHRVILDLEGISHLPEPPASLAEARTAVRNALGSNSRTTLARMRDFVQEKRP